MSVEMDKFREALSQADTGEIDMPAQDWAISIGVMHDYGHGYEWDLPKNEEGWIDIPAIIKAIEVFAKEASNY